MGPDLILYFKCIRENTFERLSIFQYILKQLHFKNGANTNFQNFYNEVLILLCKSQKKCSDFWKTLNDPTQIELYVWSNNRVVFLLKDKWYSIFLHEFTDIICDKKIYHSIYQKGARARRIKCILKFYIWTVLPCVQIM